MLNFRKWTASKGGMSAPITPLEYAPKAPAWRRRSVRRVVGGVVVVMLVLAGMRWGPGFGGTGNCCIGRGVFEV